MNAFEMALAHEQARYGSTINNSSTILSISVSTLYPLGQFRHLQQERSSTPPNPAPITQLNHLMKSIIDAYISSLSSADDPSRQLLSINVPPVQALYL